MPKTWFALIAGALLVCSALPPALAQDDDGAAGPTQPWRIILEQQLRQEKNCDFQKLILFDEFKRGNETVIEGKVQCIDGREFNFARPHEHQKFQIELCEPTIC